MEKNKKPKDIDKESWEKMTDFTLNMVSLVISLSAFALIVSLFVGIAKLFK